MASLSYYRLLDELNQHPEFFTDTCDVEVAHRIKLLGKLAYGVDRKKGAVSWYTVKKFTPKKYYDFKEEGLSDEAISNRLGVSVQSLEGFKRRFHIKVLTPNLSSARKDSLAKWYAMGATEEEVAEHLGLTVSYVKRKYKELKKEKI